MTKPYYAYEFFTHGLAPADFNRALTTNGLLSHGYARFPAEWDAIFADVAAREKALSFYSAYDDNDGRQAREIRLRAIKAIANA